MPTFWTPERIWEGQDAYIVGGGPSLRSFDFKVLRGRNTIGCNSAYMLGPDIIKVCFFADRKFFERYKGELKGWEGMKVTNCQNLLHLVPNLSWVKVMKRQTRGLGTGEELAMNYSSGAAATNLALSMGASRVYLLGMDLQAEGPRQNWHDRFDKVLPADVFTRFREGWRQVAVALPKVFPGQQVICISDVVRLSEFPIESIGHHFGEVTNVNQCGHCIQSKAS